jgi:acetate kinase
VFTFSSLQGIGHRFVHGGSRYLSTTRIDPTVIAEFEKLSYLAPLHNDACLLGIKECLALGGSIPQVAVLTLPFIILFPLLRLIMPLQAILL